jgi:hypothetical protein
MSNEMITSLPSVTSAQMSDIIYAVQGYTSPSALGLSVQETLQQVFNLFSQNIILNYPGNPNGFVAGTVYQLLWDTVDKVLYVCTTTGNAATAVWTATGAASFPVTAANGGTGVSSPAAHSIAIAEGSSPFNFIDLAAGQVLIGSTSGDPIPNTITGTGGINVASSSGSIVISGTGSSLGWNNAPASMIMIPEAGYVTTGATLVTLTLPVTASFGTALAIMGQGVGGWSIAQNAGQNIQVGNDSSTVGVTGSVSSSNRYDAIYLICVVANTTWQVLGGPQGTLTIV